MMSHAIGPQTTGQIICIRLGVHRAGAYLGLDGHEKATQSSDVYTVCCMQTPTVSPQ